MYHVDVDPLTGHPKQKTPKVQLDEYGNPVVVKSQFQQFKDNLKAIALTPTFQVGTAVPTVIFAITIILWTYGWMMWNVLCIIWTLVLVVVCIAGIAYHESSSRGYLIMPICVGGLIAVLCGSFFGLYLYDSYAIFPKFYDNSRKYTNVVASESSAAVSDGGKLTFNEMSRVDTKKGAGIVTETGKKYCVAPVKHKEEVKRVEFWAAGIECCEPVGDFKCDASNDRDAHGGVVVFDNNGWFFPARFQFYEQARMKSEAEYGLQSVARPMYVRWVPTDNLNKLVNEYSMMAKVGVIVLIIIFFILFALMQFAMFQPKTVMF